MNLRNAFIFASCAAAGMWLSYHLSGCSTIPTKEVTHTAIEVGIETVTATAVGTGTDTASAVSPAEPGPVHPWAYDQFVADHLTPAMLGADPGELCPNYKKLPPNYKKKFWSAFVRSVAFFESSYNPATDYTEKFPDNTGRLQVSSGLMQLSLDDHFYDTPFCSKITKDTIHSSEINIGCALEIMDFRIKKYPKLPIGPKPVLGAYWSTIQNTKVLPTLKTDMPGCFL